MSAPDRHPGDCADLVFQTDIRASSQYADPAAFSNNTGRCDCILATDGPAVNGNRCCSARAKCRGENLRRAENKGGIRFYLLTQGATDLTPMEAIQKDLELFHELHG